MPLLILAAATAQEHTSLDPPIMSDSSKPRSDGEPRWPITLASLAAGTAFLALWFWLLPGWLDFGAVAVDVARWRWFGLAPCILGFAIAVRCVWDFGWTGHGTPAPFAPPQRLVVVGMYRYVRNPMYLGFFMGWLGLWVVFGKANLVSLATAVALIVVVMLFVRFYEEPTLRTKFGADYEQYCHNVRRWTPRLSAWKK